MSIISRFLPDKSYFSMEKLTSKLREIIFVADPIHVDVREMMRKDPDFTKKMVDALEKSKDKIEISSNGQKIEYIVI